MAKIILEHCNQKFAVQSVIRSGDNYVLGGNIDKQVVFCPFCGQRLTALAPDVFSWLRSPLCALKKLFSKKYDELDAMLRAAALILPSLREGKRIEFYLQDNNVALKITPNY